VSDESKRLAGILLIILPTVAVGGGSLLMMLIDPASGYQQNALRQDLFRAGHAHAGVMLTLSLIILRYVDEANMSEAAKRFVRVGIPIVAILLPVAFFLSIPGATDTEPSGLIYLAYIAFGLMTVTLVTLGLGLIRK
jgi:hypothetical protein